MSAPDRLPDEALDGILDGPPSEEVAGTPLATYLAAIRDDARATAAEPSQDLQVLLAEGLDPAALAGGAGPAASGDEDARAGLLGWRLRGRTLGRVLVTKGAALGLLGKTAVAGAAVTVAASSAGAAGVLPGPAQDAFDDAVGREVAQAPADPDDASDGHQDEPASSSGDTADTPPLETDVPADATGESDDEPGVDGGDVAEDASDGRSRGDEAPGREQAPQDVPADRQQGEGAVRDTPAEDAPADTHGERDPDDGPPANGAGTRGAPERDTEPTAQSKRDAKQRYDTDTRG